MSGARQKVAAPRPAIVAAKRAIRRAGKIRRDVVGVPFITVSETDCPFAQRSASEAPNSAKACGGQPYGALYVGLNVCNVVWRQIMYLYQIVMRGQLRRMVAAQEFREPRFFGGGKVRRSRHRPEIAASANDQN